MTDENTDNQAASSPDGGVPTPPPVEPTPAAAEAPSAPPAYSPPDAVPPVTPSAPTLPPAPAYGEHVPPQPAAYPQAGQQQGYAQPGYPPQPGYAQQPYSGQPGYGQPGYPQPYAYPVAAPAAPQGLSVTSMVLGIVSVLGSFIYGIGLFPAIAAVITGHLARKRQPAAKGFWLTGLITGYIAIAIAIVWIIFIIFFVILISNNADFRNGFESGVSGT